VIRVLFVDDHPALRAGLTTVLRLEPGLVPVGSAADGEAALVETQRWEPTVVLVDYHLPGENGLVACHRLKELDPAPRVLIYSGYADAALAVPARVAGADGIANKEAPAEELLEAIRTIAKGEPLFPPPSQTASIEDPLERLEPGDRPLFDDLAGGRSPAEVAARLGLAPEEVSARTRALLARWGSAEAA
jgi:DNA-binding NarL/FixJ family response regulator